MLPFQAYPLDPELQHAPLLSDRAVRLAEQQTQQYELTGQERAYSPVVRIIASPASYCI